MSQLIIFSKAFRVISDSCSNIQLSPSSGIPSLGSLGTSRQVVTVWRCDGILALCITSWPVEARYSACLQTLQFLTRQDWVSWLLESSWTFTFHLLVKLYPKTLSYSLINLDPSQGHMHTPQNEKPCSINPVASPPVRWPRLTSEMAPSSIGRDRSIFHLQSESNTAWFYDPSSLNSYACLMCS